jgi:hypothetical protein
MLRRIVSGGQTGVDRGALEAALEFQRTTHKSSDDDSDTGRRSIEIGGWCPKGRRAEDGVISDKYPLIETELSTEYHVRTEWNVRDSDGTCILIQAACMDAGTRLTLDLTEKYRKPCLVSHMSDAYCVQNIHNWIISNQIRVLNIAGPRESSCPGIGIVAKAVISELLSLDCYS